MKIGIREQEESHRKKAGEFVLSPVKDRDLDTLEGVFKDIAGTLKWV